MDRMLIPTVAAVNISIICLSLRSVRSLYLSSSSQTHGVSDDANQYERYSSVAR
jgi:hypothetical protein